MHGTSLECEMVRIGGFLKSQNRIRRQRARGRFISPYQVGGTIFGRSTLARYPLMHTSSRLKHLKPRKRRRMKGGTIFGKSTRMYNNPLGFPLPVAFTTCHARLNLYASLDTLQQQVLYYDTDSVVYKWHPGQPSITTGDFLGDMTDELDGDVITEFVSGGAKNYGYQTRGGKVVCKVRGFTLNVRGFAILNFRTMKENILLELDSPQDSRRQLNIVTPIISNRI